MSTVDKSAIEPIYNSLFPKIALFAIFIASTSLMFQTRQLLNTATSGDKSNRAYIYESNFHDVRVLCMSEAPAIEICIAQSQGAPGEMGDPETLALAPVLTNAIFAAAGKRLRKLPVDEALLKTI
jgi:hypothetical protein